MIFFFACPECDHEFEVEGTPGHPARTYGPPEQCYDAERAEFDLDNCPNCNAPIDYGNLCEALGEAIEEAKYEAAERRAEAQREAREIFGPCDPPRD